MHTGSGNFATIFQLMVLILLIGCSSGGNLNQPMLPDMENHPQDLHAAEDSHITTDQRFSAGHGLWSYNLVSVDAQKMVAEIIPVRQVSTHWNILSWLEQGPCTDCLKITGITPSGNGTLFIDIEISHPFPSQNLTGFDVRGIAMFDGSYYFSGSSLTTPDRSLGDGELVNPDGYTTLYNYSTAGSGPDGLQGYIKGNFATWMSPDAMLNGYRRFISTDAANTRNAFYSGDSITMTYEIDMPDSWLVFGYAVDANWSPPIEKPVDDPMNDFGPEANCPEPWKIVITEEPIGDGLTHEGGSTKLTIDVFDWQGKDSHIEPVLECGQLFYGQLTATWLEDGDGYSRWEATVENENLFQGGSCKCLIAVQDYENNPSEEWWLDLTAYQICDLMVTGPPIAIGDADQNPQTEGQAVDFYDTGSYDPDGGDLVLHEWDWDNDGTYDETGSEADHTWNSAGTYYVQYRVTDDEGDTGELDTPIEIIITEAGIPSSPFDVTPPGLNHYPENLRIDGNYAYVASGPNGLEIFSISSPSNPQWITSVDISDTVHDVEISGNYAYVGSAYSPVTIVNISTPESAYVTGTIDGTHPASDMAVWGNYLYSVMENWGLQITDISDPGSPTLVNTMDYPGGMWFANDLVAQLGYVYLCTMWDGIRIIDVDPPESATPVGSIENFMPIYHGVFVDGGYLYACEANMGLQIYDISVPASPGKIKEINIDGFPHQVNVTNGLAYVTTSVFEGLHVINVNPPESAYELGYVELNVHWWNIDVAGDYAYIATGSYGLQVVDITPPESMNLVRVIDSPASTGDVVYGNGYAFVPHVYGLMVIDVDPYSSAHLVHTVPADTGFLAVGIDGNYAYATDHPDNLNIIDISSPGSASIVKQVQLTPGTASRVLPTGGYAYVLEREGKYPDETGQLHIVDVEPVSAAYVVKSLPLTGRPIDIDVSGGYAYVTTGIGKDYDGSGAFHVIDISPPDSASIIHTIEDTEEWFAGVAVSGNYAYAGIDYKGTQVIDITDPGSASIVHVIDQYSTPGRISIAGDYAYLSTGQFETADISDPLSGFIYSELYTPGTPGGLDVNGEFAYVADGYAGLRIIKLW